MVHDNKTDAEIYSKEIGISNSNYLTLSTILQPYEIEGNDGILKDKYNITLYNVKTDCDENFANDDVFVNNVKTFINEIPNEVVMLVKPFHNLNLIKRELNSDVNKFEIISKVADQFLDN